MTGSNPQTTPTPLVDLSGLAAGVLWRRRLWGFFALLGVLVGLLATVVLSAGATATTKVLVARVDDIATSQETLMATDVALFNTTATAADAVRRLDLQMTPTEFAKTFEGEALTANVLLITANGPTDSVAVRRADALADAFIAGHVERVRSEAQAQSQALSARPGEPQRELTGADSAAGEEAQEALVALPRAEAGTRIVDPPMVLNTSFLLSAAKNIAVGLVLGLTGGIALAAMLCITRDRPVLRREIATQLGVSIVSEVPAWGRGRLRPLGRGTRVNQRAADTLVRLIRASPGQVSLLELGCPRTAAALRDAIADQLDGDPPVDVGSINPGTSWLELDELGLHTLLVVRTGHARASWLHTVTRRLAEAGITPIGAVLVSPYPWDNTDGALWNWSNPAPRSRPTTNSHPAANESEVQVP